ncbi:MAG: PilZ domain-containing protein, partial [Myxococcota bacterium]
VGDQVQLMLYNGGQNYLCVDAIIRWQDVDKDLTPLGCGVEFVDLSEEQRQELRELLAAREVRMLQTGT